MRIAIVDDERPSRSELCHLIETLLPDAEIAQADSGYGALDLVTNQHFDAMFLDIHLGDIKGTSLTTMIKAIQPDLPIIFATAYDDYALKAFDLGAFDYVMKPFDPKRIRQTIEKLQRISMADENVDKNDLLNLPNKLSVTLDKHVILLDIKDISYIETVDGNCIIHSKQKEYTSTQPLSYFEKKLAEHRFFRIHKSYLINLNEVVEFFQWSLGTYCVRLRNYENRNLPISRKQIKMLKEVFDI